MIGESLSSRPTEAQLEELDRVVDTQNIPYAEARERLGMPPANNSMFTADRVQARLDAHQTHVDLYQVPDSPDGIELSPEAQATVRDMQQEAHAAAAASKLAVR